MSDVADLNNKACQPTSQALQLISNIAQAVMAKEAAGAARVGEIAVVGAEAGVLGAAAGLLGALMMLFDDTDQKIKDLQNRLNQLTVVVREEYTSQRATNIQLAMAASENANNQLKEYQALGQKVQDYQWYALLDDCTKTLAALAPAPANNLWFAVRDAQPQIYFGIGPYAQRYVYYYVPPDKTGSSVRSLGPISSSFSTYPTPDANGLVFCPIPTLAAYLQAITAFLNVGMGLCPGFFSRQEYKDEIRKHANFLRDLHQKILTEGFGFFPLPLDPWADLSPYPSWNIGGQWSWADSGRVYGCFDRFTGGYVCGIFPDVLARFPANASYGHGSFPHVPTPIRTDLYTSENMLTLRTFFYQALMIADLRAGKQLYRNELETLRSTVNSLCQLIGEQPMLPGTGFGDWSVRELWQALINPQSAAPQPEELDPVYLWRFNGEGDSPSLGALLELIMPLCSILMKAEAPTFLFPKSLRAAEEYFATPPAWVGDPPF